jgi:hypothetical protein
MEPYENPLNMGYSAEYHTGKRCIEQGCTEPAGTAWSPFWCQKHNMERMKRIDKSFCKIQERMVVKK